ncbi:Hydrogenase maturation protein, carbamoyltransferase HypF [Granulicella rosea]|uniref:Carbamoyltransferase n=1 Tax=Granulicella rosea TaxID=474952 RepID=A0A239GPJ7_9BACT|nr:carbamoyltransferase HypF [Granulicella rosea]SNS71067.1 Hydrogenase maturation protein, carbamoyltransferase HypF [Granulicella rosea]
MALVLSSHIERLRITLQGAVQGVGFRPTVYRLAEKMRLTGWVRNTDAGLEIEIEGDAEQVNVFVLQLRAATPSAAVIAKEETFRVAPRGGSGFEILPSAETNGEEASAERPRLAAILPDIVTCSECLAEVLDPENRRFGYPFTNCTQCGPRYTIVLDIPYDRPNTTMRKFQLCPSCRREYGSLHDRRFHAQPIACPICGPRLWLSPAGSDSVNLLSTAASALDQGKIVALKGIGGFQLLVDARNSSAVLRLRERKQRDQKPFAMLMPSLECVRRYCEVNTEEENLLRSAAAPIVLLQAKAAGDLAPEVAQHSSRLGVMLPASPLHHLLMAHHPFPLVATSGNLAGEPITIDNDEALDRLKDVADLFVLHDRPIARACDDSVVKLLDGPHILRRARGYAPLPVMAPHELRPVLAVGGHLKNTVAIGFGRQVWLSQHIGDLDSLEARDAFERTIEDLCKLYRFKPEVIVCDLHPDYASTRWAQRQARVADVPLVQVQHHHAHVASCAAENGLNAPYLGVAWDGAGLGLDGTIWGGEFFLADQRGFERVASLRPFALPGGEAAMRDCSRPAAGLLWETLGPHVARHSIKAEFSAMLENEINAPECSSVGRLFDAVAYLSGAAQRNHFEGQAAMSLENATDGIQTDEAYRITCADGIGDWSSLVQGIQADRLNGVRVGIISAKFHHALADWILAVARTTKTRNVVLSGGVFQNAYLTRHSRRLLEANGFHVFTHRQVPSNDGSLALGQAVLAGMMQ